MPEINYHMLLAKRIKEIRKSRGYTQKYMADNLGISQPAYSHYEHEAANCTFATIVKIAEILKVSIPFLTDIYSEIYDEDVWYSTLKYKREQSYTL